MFTASNAGFDAKFSIETITTDCSDVSTWYHQESEQLHDFEALFGGIVVLVAPQNGQSKDLTGTCA